MIMLLFLYMHNKVNTAYITFSNKPDYFLRIIVIYHYKQLSADIKMYNPSTPRCRIHWLTNTGFNIMIVHFHIRRKLDIIRYDT